MPGTFKTKKACEPLMNFVFSQANLIDNKEPNGLDDILEDEERVVDVTDKNCRDMHIEVRCADEDVTADPSGSGYMVDVRPLYRDVYHFSAEVTTSLEPDERLRRLYREHTADVVRDAVRATIELTQAMVMHLADGVDHTSPELEKLNHALDCWYYAATYHGPPTQETDATAVEAAAAFEFNLKDVE